MPPIKWCTWHRATLQGPWSPVPVNPARWACSSSQTNGNGGSGQETAALTWPQRSQTFKRRSKQPNFFFSSRQWWEVLIFPGFASQPALFLCLASFNDILQFHFFKPENVVWFCKCFLAVVLFRPFSSLFFGGLNLPLVTLSAPLWSPRRRLTLSLKKPGQGQTTAWLGTLTTLWSPGYGEIISKF